MLRFLPALVRRLTPWRRDDREGMARLAPFLRGVSMGALVGAAIAGSTIWTRRSRRRPERDR